MKKIIAFTALLLILLAPPASAERLVLMLDWFPNVDHVPIYVALEEGLFAKRGINLEIQSPMESADPVKLAASGNVDLALSYQPQIIIAAAQGIPLKAVGRLVDTPLTTVLFIKGRGIERPSDLEGKTIGYTVPGMMDHLAEAFAAVNGIGKYTMVNVGFSILQSLASGKVDAVMGPFQNYEPVALEMEGLEPGYFEIEEHGIPTYDELVFVTGNRTWEAKREAIDGFMAALEEGMARTAEDPDEALRLYFEGVPDAPKEMEKEAFERTRAFFGPDTILDVTRWRLFAAFALEHGLVDREVNLDDIVVQRAGR